MTEPNGHSPRPHQAGPAGQDWTDEAVDAAGGLDLLLTDAALGMLRRLRPDGSLLRLAAGLARRPELVGRQKDSPPALGGPDHPARGAAPGTYVHDR